MIISSYYAKKLCSYFIQFLCNLNLVSFTENESDLLCLLYPFLCSPVFHYWTFPYYCASVTDDRLARLFTEKKNNNGDSATLRSSRALAPPPFPPILSLFTHYVVLILFWYGVLLCYWGPLLWFVVGNLVLWIWSTVSHFSWLWKWLAGIFLSSGLELLHLGSVCLYVRGLSVKKCQKVSKHVKKI